MKQRLEQFLIEENLTQAQFADSIQVARAAVSHILAGRNNPGYDFIVNMMKAYPDLNIEWLLTGKGEMYKDSQHSPAQTSLFMPQPTKNEKVISSNTLSEATNNLNPQALNDNTEAKSEGLSPTSRHSTRIIVFYSDNSYEEFRPSEPGL